jgi:prepilin-type N-terminal cleavage/methylation domain-containing protein
MLATPGLNNFGDPFRPLLKNPHKGFTLIEMAIVLLIITLIVSSAIGPLGAQIELRRRAETQKSLDEIREALIGYALSQGMLPCPAIAPTSGSLNNGIANCTVTTGIATGYIPWVTLGVNNQDAWGNLIRYAVDTKFTTAFTLQTPGAITIQTRDASGGTPSISSNIPAVVFSLGKNGYGALSATDYIPQSSVPASNLDEKQNIAANSTTYYSRTPTPPGTATALGGEFDDMLVWISPNILFNRMVAAGKLP